MSLVKQLAKEVKKQKKKLELKMIGKLSKVRTTNAENDLIRKELENELRAIKKLSHLDLSEKLLMEKKINIPAKIKIAWTAARKQAKSKIIESNPEVPPIDSGNFEEQISNCDSVKILLNKIVSQQEYAAKKEKVLQKKEKRKNYTITCDFPRCNAKFETEETKAIHIEKRHQQAEYESELEVDSYNEEEDPLEALDRIKREDKMKRKLEKGKFKDTKRRKIKEKDFNDEDDSHHKYRKSERIEAERPEPEEKLHPSWQAKRQETKPVEFQGKKITF